MESNFALRWRKTFLVLGFIYLFAYMVLYWTLPGHAVTGRVTHGRYFVNYHAYFTEVPSWLYYLSLLAFWGIPVAICAIFISLRGSFVDDKHPLDQPIQDILVEQEPYGFRLTVSSMKQFTGAIILTLPVILLTILFLAALLGTIVALIHARLEALHGMFVLVVLTPLTAVFWFNFLQCLVGFTTSIRVDDQAVRVVQGFGRLGWKQMIHVNTGVTVSYQAGSNRTITIKSKDGDIRFGKFLNDEQRARVAKILSDQFNI